MLWLSFLIPQKEHDFQSSLRATLSVVKRNSPPSFLAHPTNPMGKRREGEEPTGSLSSDQISFSGFQPFP